VVEEPVALHLLLILVAWEEQAGVVILLAVLMEKMEQRILEAAAVLDLMEVLPLSVETVVLA